MLRLLLWRAVFFAAPFAAYFIWREIARRSGRAMGATPWGWLVGAGAVLVGLSLMASVALHKDNRGETYVPGEVTTGGQVTPGYFEPRTKP